MRRWRPPPVAAQQQLPQQQAPQQSDPQQPDPQRSASPPSGSPPSGSPPSGSAQSDRPQQLESQQSDQQQPDPQQSGQRSDLQQSGQQQSGQQQSGQQGQVDQPQAPSGQLPAGGTRVCDKFGSTPVANGRYVVQNDVWGTDGPQCVRAFDTGFAVEGARFANTSQPASYPSIFAGCNYGTCTAGTTLPRQITALPAVTSSWSVTVAQPGERWDAAYDIWFDPTPRRTGRVTGTEMMIWLDHNGVQPIGKNTGTVDIAGATWEVWRGSNGAQVVSYVRTTPIRDVRGLPLTAFFDDAAGRGAVRPDWYLTSVQAGFEPWTGGPGLATTAFSVDGVTN